PTIGLYSLSLHDALPIFLNKVDLPSANPELVTDDIVELLGCHKDDVIPASAKTGIGIEEILSAIIERIPPPKGKPDAPLRALVRSEEHTSELQSRENLVC